MNKETVSLFPEHKQPQPKKEDDFAASCLPLAQLLDSVRHIEGFPIGRDEDILALSDPPYYTACPNPYLKDFIKHYGKPYDEANDIYERTPFVGDVSEGKNDPIYNAHSYHTKVPHKAIMKYIEHYTEEGDIVFDGFCGSGMTGVAAQMLNRRAVLSDLSPAATFIANNYNTPVDVAEFDREAKRILDEVEKECGWMYETVHTDGKTKGKINYTVWSDVFICPYCNNEYIFWDAAVNMENGKVKDKYTCPHCAAEIRKRDCKRAEVTFFDRAIDQQVTQAKQVPVLINYTIGKKRFEKKPEQFDLNLFRKIEESAIPYWYPTERMPEGDEARRNDRIGITHIHHFYTKRNLWTAATFLNKSINKSEIMFCLTGACLSISKMYRYTPNYEGGGPLSGTLYVPSVLRDISALDAIARFVKKLPKVFSSLHNDIKYILQTGSTTTNLIAENSIDYIFTDPPFGDNIMYSELNFLWESWLKVFTNNRAEAIINQTQHKGLYEYKELMTACFKEMYRILKPNRWITVEFHNSKAAVWNAIQDAMTKAGFIVAQVAVLDKQQDTFKQVTSAGAVKNDLVINAYKPKRQFEDNFLKRGGEGLERVFVADLLDHLPAEPNIGRTEQMLYSKMLAHYVQRGFEIRLNARQFYTLLKDNFKMIDGYWFTDRHILIYEEWKKKQGLDKVKEIKSGQQILFVNDERSALVWLYNYLETPRSFSDIYTAYNKAVAGNDDIIPELKELLNNNFIFEDKCYRCPRTEEEKGTIGEQRERELARAFERLLVEARSGGKKLKEVRKEAVSYGFTKAYQEKRFEDILTVAKKLDHNILEANSEINDFVEIARFKTGEDI